MNSQDIGHRSHLLAKRDAALAANPHLPASVRSRILGVKVPYSPPSRIHRIEVNLRTGERTVKTEIEASMAPRYPREPDLPPPEAPKQNPFVPSAKVIPILPPRPAVRNAKVRLGRAEIMAVIEAVAVAFHVTTDAILSCGRAQRAYRPRFAVYRRLLERGMSTGAIGLVLNRDHSSICSGARKAQELYRFDADWRMRFDAAFPGASASPPDAP